MNNNSTLERMKELKLWGMHQYLEASLKTREHEHTTADELLAFLIEAEYDYKRTKRINAALHKAGFRYPATIEEISFGKSRNLDKNSFMRLADCSFVEKKEVIIVTGPTGVGKSKLVSALGHQACIKGYSVRYFNMSKLFSLLNMAKADNTYLKEMARIAKLDVLTCF
jgi:DNA replication protein DnaC